MFIGHIKEIVRYPVKSFNGEKVNLMKSKYAYALIQPDKAILTANSELRI